MLFNDVQAILSTIQSDPELQRLAFAECEDLYRELFIGHGSEHTGADILSSMDLSYESHRQSVKSYLKDILAIENEIEKIKIDLNTENESLVYIELMNRRSQSVVQISSPFEQHYHPVVTEEPCGCETSCDCNIDYSDDDDDYALYDTYEDYDDCLYNAAEDRELNRLVEEQYDRLLEVMKNTVYVTLVNYKGEGECDAILGTVAHLRTFYSKYSYGG